MIKFVSARWEGKQSDGFQLFNIFRYGSIISIWLWNLNVVLEREVT